MFELGWFMEEETKQELNERNKKEESLVGKLLESGKDFFVYNSDVLVGLGISYSAGVGLGALGSGLDKEWIPVIPPVIDFFSAGIISPGKLVFYAAYVAGVATAYADKVYPYIPDKFF